MKLALMLLLAVRTYYPVSISDLAAGRNSHTHIRVTGKVVLVKHEADGDLHIRLSDGKHWIVAECIPKLPCAEPKMGQTITVEGIYRRDVKHGGWAEVHPVESIASSDGSRSAVDNDSMQIRGPVTMGEGPPMKATGHTCGEFSCDEPAIHESYIAHHKGEAWGCGLDACLATEDEYKFRPACADKTRILMHDEQNPPKFWCYAPHQ